MANAQTEHYGLNQWSPGDPVLREEFNQDNAKIEEILCELEAQQPMVRLKHEVLQTAAKSYRLDLTSVNPGDFSGLRFLIRSTSGGGGWIGLQLNGLTDNYEYTSTGMLNPDTMDAVPVASVGTFLSWVELRPLGSWTVFTSDAVTVSGSRVEAAWRRGIHRELSYDEIQTVDLVNLNSSETVLLGTGTEITLFGLQE